MKKVFASILVTALCSIMISPGLVHGQRSRKAEKLARAEAASLLRLQNKLARKGIAPNDVKTLRVFEDKDRPERVHTHVQQTHNGVPVFGGEAIVHLDAVSGEEAQPTTDTLVPDVSVHTTPGMTAKEAVGLAKAQYKAKKGCDECLTGEPQADLWVLRHEGADHLVYRVQLARLDGTEHTSEPVYFIDAHTGALVWGYDNLQTQAATGTGVSLYSGTQPINTIRSGSSYYMEDLSRAVGTFDNRNSAKINTTMGYITSYGSVYRFADADNLWNASTAKAGVDAHYGAAKVYDYFLSVHGRNGIDGSGGPRTYASVDGSTGLISSIVHFGKSYNNAFWSSSKNQMFYGDGDGVNFSPLVTLDICGHEMQHGITSRTANLTYANESGALNESWSDVFGAMVELYAEGAETTTTWWVGEDANTPGVVGDALRYMDRPHNAGNYGYTANDDPDHYSERYTGTGDNGGVHINSGIPNHVFYLLAKGGPHAHVAGTPVTGIGADKAAAIWYKALTTYMTSSTNFAGARAATINAADALYGAGSAESLSVAQAWAACGVL
ncbi:MAG TPA: M4 family metallopeptidase [Pyrinomonadaceae bacterium]|nr:M4 family metallopeptidase [Pyrinomonadaceae bacterium]